MFIVENGKITSEKTLDLGKRRSVDLAFAFDASFEDADKFELSIADTTNTLYGFTNSGKLSFSNVDFSFIAEAEKTVAVTIKHNETEILADELTITAVVSGGGGGADLGSYKGKISIASENDKDAVNFTAGGDISSLTFGFNKPGFVAPTMDEYPVNVFTKGWNVGVIGGYQVLINAGGQTIIVNKSTGINLDANDLQWRGNGLNYNSGLCLLNDDGNIPFYVTEPQINETSSYGDLYFRFDNGKKIDWYTHYGAALTFHDDEDFYLQRPDGLTKRMQNNCVTKEIWITPTEEISSISIPEYIQVIGDMPQTLQATKEILWNGSTYSRNVTHVFVVRGINYNGRWIYTINYSYNFISDYDSIFN